MELKKALQSIKIHGIIFDATFLEMLQKCLDKYNISSVIENKCWRINHNRFIQTEWKTVFAFMIQAPCSELYLHKNNHDKIIKDISMPNLSVLKVLTLSDNNICSIEELQFIRTPIMKKLTLGNNKITKVKALNKCTWNELITLQIGWNPIKQIDLSRLKIKNSEKEQNSQLSAWIHQIQDTGEFASSLAKLVFDLTYLNNRQIKNSRVIQSVKNKCIQFD